MEVKQTYLGTMIALATTAFGLLAAGAWNNAISSIFKKIFPGTGDDWIGLLVYAIAVTIIAVVVVQNLAKIADKGPST